MSPRVGIAVAPAPSARVAVDGADIVVLVTNSHDPVIDGGWLVPGAMVVVERSSRSPRPTWPAGIEAERHKRYGETTLWYGHAL